MPLYDHAHTHSPKLIPQQFMPNQKLVDCFIKRIFFTSEHVQPFTSSRFTRFRSVLSSGKNHTFIISLRWMMDFLNPNSNSNFTEILFLVVSSIKSNFSVRTKFLLQTFHVDYTVGRCQRSCKIIPGQSYVNVPFSFKELYYHSGFSSSQFHVYYQYFASV